MISTGFSTLGPMPNLRSKIGGVHWFAEVITLPLIAVLARQGFGLALRFNAFRRDLQVQGGSETDDGMDDRGTGGGFADVLW